MVPFTYPFAYKFNTREAVGTAILAILLLFDLSVLVVRFAISKSKAVIRM